MFYYILLTLLLLAYLIPKILAFQSKRTLKRRVQALLPTYTNKPTKHKGKRYFLLVNPYSGEQKGAFILNHVVKPILDACEVKYEIVTTAYQGHAEEIGVNFNPDGYDGIIVISGDGLLHEFICGLFKNRGLDQVKSIFECCPIGVVPVGTGNGIATSFTSSDPVLAVDMMLKGDVKYVDVCQIDLAQDGVPVDRVYDLLGFDGGAVVYANDLIERRFRHLLPNPWLRDFVSAMLVIGLKPKINLEVHFKPKEGDHVDYNTFEDLPDSEVYTGCKVLEGDFFLYSILNVPYISYESKLAPYVKMDGGELDMVIVKSDASRAGIVKMFLISKDGSHTSEEHFFYYKSTEIFVKCTDGSTFTSGGEILKDANEARFKPLSNIVRVMG